MLLSRLRSALACTLFALATTSLAQTTINVGPNQPHTTIQSGIDAAQDGDTVLVAPGTYKENISFNGKAITVTSSGGPTVTTIDGSGKGATATVAFLHDEKNTSVIANFTIRGGGNSTFDGNSDGGVYVNNASPVIRDNIITANYCHNIDVQFGIATILNNEVSGVLQDFQGTQGESYCSFPSGIHLGGTPNPPPFVDFVPGTTVIGNTIEKNLTGSGINLWAAQNVLVSNNTIRNNVSSDPGSAFISVNDHGTVVFQNLIYGNTSTCGGALSFMEGGSSPSNPSILIANNTIVDNVVAPKYSGSECTDISQIYPDPYAYGSSGPGAVIINNILSGSTPYPAVNCSRYDTPSESNQPTFQNNILYNPGGPFFGSFCVDVSGKYNNVVADPEFVDPSHNDYRLKSTSPAIDAGRNSVLQTFLAMTGNTVSTDLDKNPRIQDATGHGCTIDIGAYEYPGSKTICGTTETLHSSANPSSFNQAVTFIAQLSSQNGVPTGTIQFSDGGTILATDTVSATGASAFTTSQLSVGTHTITAAYEPTGNFPAANATVTQVVNGYQTTTQLSSSLNPATAGQGITLTANVGSQNGIPGGSVTFSDGSTTLGTVTLTSGTVVYSTSALPVGTHQITASFAPSGEFAGSSATLTENINGKATTNTLVVTPNPVTAFGTLTLTAYLSAASGSPSGSVSFNANGAKLGTATLTANGQALLTAPAPLPGTYSITAVYSGDATYQSSTSAAVSETVLPAPSGTIFTASPNPAYQAQTVNLSALVSGAAGHPPVGTVTFYDGSAALGTGVLSASGAATLTVSTLAPGTHTLTASYQASGAYTGSTSSPVQEVILPGTFGITLSPSALTLRAATQGTVQVALTSIGGFSGPLQLSLGAMPAYANATISPATVTLSAGESGAATLLLNASMARLEPSTYPCQRPAATVLAALVLFLIPRRWKGRRRLHGLFGMLLLTALLTGASGCGMIRSPFHMAAPGIYQVPVSATDNNHNSRSAMLTVTVTQ